MNQAYLYFEGVGDLKKKALGGRDDLVFGVDVYKTKRLFLKSDQEIDATTVCCTAQ